MSACVGDPLGILHIVCVGKDGTGGVADSDLRMTALAVGGVDGGFQVFDIVERVKNTDDINTVRNGTLHQIFHTVIRIVAIAEHILSAEKHLQLGVGTMELDGAQALPRILVEKAQAGVIGRAAPAFQRIVADPVERIQNREHVLRCHSGGDQRLVRVAQRGFGYFDFLCHNLFSPAISSM